MVSVVRRVTSELVVKWSMLEKLNDWMLAYMSCLRFLARPAEAFEAVMPPPVPIASETRASRMRVAEWLATTSMPAPSVMRSMRSEV